VLDPRGRLLLTVLGFAGLTREAGGGAPEIQMLRRWLDSWPGLGAVAQGMARQGYDLQLTRYRRARLASELLRDGYPPLECCRFGLGVDAVASGAGRGVGSAEVRADLDGHRTESADGPFFDVEVVAATDIPPHAIVVSREHHVVRRLVEQADLCEDFA
jgi:hypothetical protein